MSQNTSVHLNIMVRNQTPPLRQAVVYLPRGRLGQIFTRFDDPNSDHFGDSWTSRHYHASNRLLSPIKDPQLAWSQYKRLKLVRKRTWKLSLSQRCLYRANSKQSTPSPNFIQVAFPYEGCALLGDGIVCSRGTDSKRDRLVQWLQA